MGNSNKTEFCFDSLLIFCLVTRAVGWLQPLSTRTHSKYCVGLDGIVFLIYTLICHEDVVQARNRKTERNIAITFNTAMILHANYNRQSKTTLMKLSYIVCYLKTFTSYHKFYTLHVVELLRYDSVLIKETNELMN